MICPNCQNENRDGAKFCDECGFKLEDAIAANEDLHETTSEDPAEDDECVEESPLDEDAAAGESEEEFVEESDSSEADGVPEEESAPCESECDENDSEDLDKTDVMEAVEADADSLDSDKTQALDALEVEGGEDVGDADITRKLDLTGFDQPGADAPYTDYGERIAGPDYVAPTPQYRDGQTMEMPRVAGEEPEETKDYLASETAPKAKSRKPLIIVLIIVIAAALVAGITYQLELWGGKSVPDVTNMTEAEATEVLEDAGFSVRSMMVKSDDEAGIVLITDPSARSRAYEGTEVIIHISEPRVIPDIVGILQDEAAKELEAEGYESVTFVKTFSDESPGTVLAVEPAVGTVAKSTEEVKVSVAEPYTVPDISGMTYDEAARAIADVGLQSQVVYIDTEEYPDGTIIGTDPRAGSHVDSDKVISIQIARARAAQLTEATYGVFYPGASVTIGMVTYQIESVSSVQYLGNEQTSVVATGSPYTSFLGETVFLSSRQVNAVITWNPDNTVASIN